MRVARWLKCGGDRCEVGEPLCEVVIDGETRILQFLDDDPPMTAGIYRTLVDEGEEVGPWGDLIEYSPDGALLKYPHSHKHLEQLGLLEPRKTYKHDRDSYPSIFLNYRQTDSEAWAGRLHEALAREFDEDSVFMDAFGLLGGEDFEWTVQQAAAHCNAMIVMIGEAWLTIKDERTQQRRLVSWRDYVRREIAAALDRQIFVLPILLPRAAVPKASDLPTDLCGLEKKTDDSTQPSTLGGCRS